MNVKRCLNLSLVAEVSAQTFLRGRSRRIQQGKTLHIIFLIFSENRMLYDTDFVHEVNKFLIIHFNYLLG